MIHYKTTKQLCIKFPVILELDAVENKFKFACTSFLHNVNTFGLSV